MHVNVKNAIICSTPPLTSFLTDTFLHAFNQWRSQDFSMRGGGGVASARGHRGLGAKPIENQAKLPAARSNGVWGRSPSARRFF